MGIEHKAGWNDSVHILLLEVALSGESSISHRNDVLPCLAGLPPDFLQDNPSLFNVKIDHAILLDFPPKSSLASARLPSAGGELPALPVIFVHGARWRIDFAQRTTDELLT
ncbi:hypothetical protein LX36DRAFT_715684 [Colletotrichum falcatum]|nr:hypothetical protein LX36DRAFT_715684 [Colletotrichum falcatum]